jgi:hypothetical protein
MMQTLKTGSIINQYTNNTQLCCFDAVQIGTPATILAWTDRIPGTVINKFFKGNVCIVEIQEDVATRIDNNGISEIQQYTFSRNPRGKIFIFKSCFKKYSYYWVEIEKNTKTNRFNLCKHGYALYLGHREKYHDFSF